MLPSIRGLAKDLRISVITTKRAYDELEKDGFINSVAGKGCFVAEKNLEIIKEENLKKVEQYLEKAVKFSRTCGLTKDDLIENDQDHWKRMNNEECIRITKCIKVTCRI